MLAEGTPCCCWPATCTRLHAQPVYTRRATCRTLPRAVGPCWRQQSVCTLPATQCALIVLAGGVQARARTSLVAQRVVAARVVAAIHAGRYAVLHMHLDLPRRKGSGRIRGVLTPHLAAHMQAARPGALPCLVHAQHGGCTARLGGGHALLARLLRRCSLQRRQAQQPGTASLHSAGSKAPRLGVGVSLGDWWGRGSGAQQHYDCFEIYIKKQLSIKRIVPAALAAAQRAHHAPVCNNRSCTAG